MKLKYRKRIRIGKEFKDRVRDRGVEGDRVGDENEVVCYTHSGQ